MNILKRVAKGVVKKAAVDVLVQATDGVIKVLDKVSDTAEQKSQRKIADFLSKNPDHIHLFLNQRLYTRKEFYQVFDAQQQVKYVVKGELLSRKHHLHVYDASGKHQLGTVKEKMIAFRPFFSFEANPKDFVVEVNGKKLGKIKSRQSVSKRKFEVTFNNWQIEGNFTGKNFKVMSGDNLIMEVSREYGYKGDMYFVDITDPANEFLCLLVVLAIDAASMSKEEKKRVRKRRLL